jgi:hypothetical protein
MGTVADPASSSLAPSEEEIESQMADLKDQPDDYIALSAGSTCAGFIGTLRSRVGYAQV